MAGISGLSRSAVLIPLLMPIVKRRRSRGFDARIFLVARMSLRFRMRGASVDGRTWDDYCNAPPSHTLERGGVTISGGARAHTIPRCHLDCQFMLHPPHHFFSTASRQFGILMAVHPFPHPVRCCLTTPALQTLGG